MLEESHPGSPFHIQIAKIDGLKKVKSLPNTSAVCLHLMKLLHSGRHVCYLDNFFTRVELLTHLRKNGYAACGTAKQGSGIHPDLVTLREISKKAQHWVCVQSLAFRMRSCGWPGKTEILYCS